MRYARIEPFLPDYTSECIFTEAAQKSRACGLLLTAGGALLQGLTGLPVSLMFYAGLSLFPFAAFLVYAATRKSISKTALWAIIRLNLL